MEWNSPENPAFVGEDAGGIYASCYVAWALGDWPEDTRKRCMLSDGRAAWCGLTTREGNAGNLYVVCITPADAFDGAEYVSLEDMHGSGPLPADWLTKGRAGLYPGARPPVEWSLLSAGGMCIAILEKPGRVKPVLLCRVAELNPDGTLYSVQISAEDERATPVAGFKGVRRWLGITRYVDGFRMLWEAGRVEAASWQAIIGMAWRKEGHLAKLNKERAEAKAAAREAGPKPAKVRSQRQIDAQRANMAKAREARAAKREGKAPQPAAAVPSTSKPAARVWREPNSADVAAWRDEVNRQLLAGEPDITLLAFMEKRTT